MHIMTIIMHLIVDIHVLYCTLENQVFNDRMLVYSIYNKTKTNQSPWDVRFGSETFIRLGLNYCVFC